MRLRTHTPQNRLRLIALLQKKQPYFLLQILPVSDISSGKSCPISLGKVRLTLRKNITLYAIIVYRTPQKIKCLIPEIVFLYG